MKAELQTFQGVEIKYKSITNYKSQTKPYSN